MSERAKGERLRSQGLPLLGRAAKWLAVLVVVSVMVPALTTQWSDRQKELDLKTSLVSRITRSAASATQDASNLVNDEAKSPTIKDEIWRAQYRSILKEWRIAAFTLESELAAYFPEVNVRTAQPATLAEAFAKYNDMIQNYIRLSLDECSDHTERRTGRRMAIEAISDYLGETVPRVIKTDPPGTGAGPRCWKKSEGFRASYQTLGESLLEERNTLVGAVIRSNAAGYNVGVKDFIHQVMPFF